MLNKKQSNDRRSAGIILVEAVLATTLLSLLAVVVIDLINPVLDGVLRSGEHHQALSSAEEGLEAVRAIRDDDFDQLQAGEYGLQTEDGEWVLVDEPVEQEGFIRRVNIAELGENSRRVEVECEPTDEGRPSVSLVSRLTDWRRAAEPACEVHCRELGYSGGTCRTAPEECQEHGEIWEDGGDEYCRQVEVYRDDSGGVSDGDDEVVYYEQTANVSGLDEMHLAYSYYLEEGHHGNQEVRVEVEDEVVHSDTAVGENEWQGSYDVSEQDEVTVRYLMNARSHPQQDNDRAEIRWAEHEYYLGND